jgi:hypothetical protein
MILGMVILGAAFLATFIWALLASGDKAHWEKVASRLFVSEAAYFKQINESREEADAQRAANRRLEHQKRQAELAMEMAEHNLEVTQEHLRYYIETLAEAEKPPEFADSNAEVAYLYNKVGLLQKLLAQQFFKDRENRQKIAALEHRLEFNDMTMSQIPEFSQISDAYDPKNRNDRDVQEQ